MIAVGATALENDTKERRTTTCSVNVPLYVTATGYYIDISSSVIVSNVLSFSVIDAVLTKVHRKKETCIRILLEEGYSEYP